MSLPPAVKRVVASLAMEAVLEAVRGYFLRILRDVTPEHMYRAIKEDVDLWDISPKHVKSKGTRWARKLRKYEDRVNSKLVLQWLKVDRPELASIIENVGPKGAKWLSRETEKIKAHLWPPLEKPEKTKKPLKLVKQVIKAEEEKPEEKEPVKVRIVHP